MSGGRLSRYIPISIFSHTPSRSTFILRLTTPGQNRNDARPFTNLHRLTCDKMIIFFQASQSETQASLLIVSGEALWPQRSSWVQSSHPTSHQITLTLFVSAASSAASTEKTELSFIMLLFPRPGSTLWPERLRREQNASRHPLLYETFIIHPRGPALPPVFSVSSQSAWNATLTSAALNDECPHAASPTHSCTQKTHWT